MRRRSPGFWHAGRSTRFTAGYSSWELFFFFLFFLATAYNRRNQLASWSLISAHENEQIVFPNALSRRNAKLIETIATPPVPKRYLGMSSEGWAHIITASPIFVRGRDRERENQVARFSSDEGYISHGNQLLENWAQSSICWSGSRHEQIQGEQKEKSNRGWYATNTWLIPSLKERSHTGNARNYVLNRITGKYTQAVSLKLSPGFRHWFKLEICWLFSVSVRYLRYRKSRFDASRSGTFFARDFLRHLFFGHW